VRGEGFARNESAEAVGDDVHDIPELHDPCCERVGRFTQGHVQGLVVKALGREAGGAQPVAQEKRLQAV
jgi:hypothetical protein